MSEEAAIGESANFFLGEDKVFRFYVRTGADVECSAQAANGATSISVEPLEEALSSGDRVRFAPSSKAGVVATLSAPAVVGATSLTVSATSGIIALGTVGRKVQDVTGYTSEWVLRDGPTGAALLTKTPTITDALNGILEVAIADTDTVDASGTPIIIQPGRYYHSLRKTNAGDESVLAHGECVLRLGATR